MFDTDYFEQHLAASWLGRSFFFFDELESTNTYAKKLNDPVSGTLVLADDQTAGRGQHSRKWLTTAADNLTFSLIFTPSLADRVTLLTLACASAIEDVLRTFDKASDFSLKWPNDVYCNGKKIAGLLTEVIFNGNKVDRIIAGIGLNINQRKFEGELEETAISLALATGKQVSREQFLADLLVRLEYNYQRWLNASADLVKEINPKIQGYGKWVTLEVEGKKMPEKRKFLGMNEQGALQALNKELEVSTFAYEQVRIKLD